MKRFKMLFLLLTAICSLLPALLYGQVDTTSAVRYNQTVNIIFQIIFMIIGVFLSVALTRLLARNGQVLREMRNLGEKIDEGFRRMDERTQKISEKISELIVMEAEKTRELIKALKG